MPAEPQRREGQTGAGKSDRVVVPKRPSNVGGGKDATPPPRARRATAARRGGELETRLDRITQRAREHPQEVFTNLYHHLDVELMAACFRELKDGKAPGIDGVTKAEYEQDLEGNLAGVLARLRNKTYDPQPSRRRYIPKVNGELRPLGIPCLEDKIVQKAMSRVLERIYEEKFYDFSYGFRPGRSCHDALKALSRNIGTKKVNWIVEADIKGFFDHVNHDWLLAMVAHRVSDPQMLWLIGRFLKAGVMEDGRRLDTTEGTPQGGVISALLANVYLHYVLDDWFAKGVRKRIRGEAYVVRYADDFVVCFQYESDARWFLTALGERLAKFNLELEPSKTRVFEFGRFAQRDAERRGEGGAEVFDFLGFTHYCGTSRKGRFKLKWRTAKRRFRAKQAAMKEWIRAMRTAPLRAVWEGVNRKLQGHYAYFGVSDNWGWLGRFRTATMKLLYKWMNRRSQRRTFTFEGFLRYVDQHRIVVPTQLVNLNSAYV